MTDIILSVEAKSLKLGQYEHYKGHKYEVIGIAVHSETLEEMVIYKALYGQSLVWVRPLKMFIENVVIDGKIRPRFSYLGN